MRPCHRPWNASGAVPATTSVSSQVGAVRPANPGSSRKATAPASARATAARSGELRSGVTAAAV
jgi:hypothetical protein